VRCRIKTTTARGATVWLIRQFPTSVIFQHEAGDDELKEFTTGNTLFTRLMVNFSDAREALQEHGCLDAIHAGCHPIVAATEDDRILEDRQRDDIRRVLERVPSPVPLHSAEPQQIY
jgi:hypothetical protein